MQLTRHQRYAKAETYTRDLKRFVRGLNVRFGARRTAPLGP